MLFEPARRFRSSEGSTAIAALVCGPGRRETLTSCGADPAAPAASATEVSATRRTYTAPSPDDLCDGTDLTNVVTDIRPLRPSGSRPNDGWLAVAAAGGREAGVGGAGGREAGACLEGLGD